MLPDTDSGKIKSQPGERLTITVGDKQYGGTLIQGQEALLAESTDGYRLEICVRPMAEGESAADASALRHLRPFHSIPDVQNGRVFECFELLRDKPRKPLGELLFTGFQMDVQTRMKLCLSLAAAGAELEAFMASRPLRCIDLDAFLVDEESYDVLIDVKQLIYPEAPEKTEEACCKMRTMGILPPECYEDETLPPVSVEVFRHILAVLLFRGLTNGDPFDGNKTYFRYPIRTNATLRKIYGRNADYVGERGVGENSVGAYIGRSIPYVMSRICPARRKIFTTAFCEGIQEPEKRPSARALLENQCRIMESFLAVDKDWRVVDPMTGEGVPANTGWLRTANGVTISLYNGRPLFRYMFAAERFPTDDRTAGRIVAGENGLVIAGAEDKPVPLKAGGTDLAGGPCEIVTQPWREMGQGNG